ncbi:MAG: twin transmembrane helix small protein [Nitrosomonadales bacterium]|nr:twin transmembrane helix small protein [Nitrosomonadales bacterium]MBT3918022.1 twin transmembrane helix small protein [Nitrosomonadales bacterium]MBT4182984.1 twin transmembrane helix small protein [Nitrosomonadales bacterium]MBT4760044.1 twin transmembrane helix small protein [Nitrosomonadales bacterium]MBT5150713.1 twin transmembrane helix small protein [Nitrosomonadales bacterium]
MEFASIYKFIVILLLVIILLSLTKGLHFLVKDDEKSLRMVKSLTLRIVLSVLLFILLFFGFYMGWLSPNHL